MHPPCELRIAFAARTCHPSVGFPARIREIGRRDVMRFLSLILAAGAVVLGLTAPSAAQDPIVIRFSHVVAENTPKGAGTLMFKRLVEERLAGRVRVEVYPRSQRFNDDQVLLALLFGDVEMAAPSLAKFRAYSRALQVFDLPFLFEDVDHVHRFQNGPAGQALLQSMRNRGIEGLAYWENGMRVISAAKPIRHPADVRDLLFRIEPSSVFQEQWTRVGAVGIAMPFSRVTDAIRDGIVDAQENAWSNIRSRGIHHLHRHFTEMEHSYLGYMVVASTEFWNGLPADVRGVLEETLAEVTVEVNRRARAQAEADRRAVMDAEAVTVIQLTEAEKDPWREALSPLWDRFEAEIGRDVIAAARAAKNP